MSISSEFGKIILELEVIFAELEKVLFPMSLIDATIQDGSTRVRRDDNLSSFTIFFFLN